MKKQKVFIQISPEDELPIQTGEYMTNMGTLNFSYQRNEEGLQPKWRDKLGFGYGSIEWWLKEEVVITVTEKELEDLIPAFPADFSKLKFNENEEVHT